MGSVHDVEKPHVVCVPAPAQGHINPMSMLAKLLHSRGFHVTFAHTHYNYGRLLRSHGPHALDGLPSFRFVSFPDGLPHSEANVTQDIPALCESLERNCVGPFIDLLKDLDKADEEGKVPRISCIIADVAMPFTLDAAKVLGMKVVMLWTASACGLLGYHHYPRLLRQGYVPLKDASDLTNGYLDTPIDQIPSMKGIRLKDIPSFLRTTNPKDIMFNYMKSVVEKSSKASAIILNTYDALEHDVLTSLAPDFPPFYTISPLHVLVTQIDDEETKSIGSSLWKEDQRCIDWLDSKAKGTVIYVNFGSITVMSNTHLIEFAFGLANSGKDFLWVIRPDLVEGETAVLPKEFVEESKERSLLVDWCDQARVLNHSAVGGFLTHSGWNSTMESICAGVPMISWPFFGDQQTNCWSLWNVWGIGMELYNDVKRENVEKQVRELMDGDKGDEMRRKAIEWKLLAHEVSAKANGDSWTNLDNLINDHVLISPNY